MLLGACGPGDGRGQASLSGPAPVSPAPVPSLPAEAPAEPGPTTTGPGAVMTTRPVPTTRPAPAATTTTTTTAVTARPVAPAAAGTYLYDTAGQATVGALVTPFPSVTSLVVDQPAGARQRSTRDLRDPAGAGPVFETVLEYRPDGAHLVSLRLTATVLLLTQTVELRPSSPELLVPTGAAPGDRREIDVSVAGGGTARLVVEVVGEEVVTVGGQAVAATVVRLSGSVPGQLDARLDLTVWLDPTRGLWVKERAVAEASSGDGGLRYTSQYEATLQRLTPG